MTSEEFEQGYAVCSCGKYAHVFRAATLAKLPKGYSGELCKECSCWMVAVEKLTPNVQVEGAEGGLPPEAPLERRVRRLFAVPPEPTFEKGTRVHTPTMTLRFVEREEESNLTADGHLLPHDVVRVVKRRVLQQMWVSAYVGELSQWRDVPLEDETPNVQGQGDGQA